MSKARSPFKFLDPFTLADRSVFFGRDKEVETLYRLVLKTPLSVSSTRQRADETVPSLSAAACH